jgi:primosomal protein N'
MSDCEWGGACDNAGKAEVVLAVEVREVGSESYVREEHRVCKADARMFLEQGLDHEDMMDRLEAEAKTTKAFDALSREQQEALKRAAKNHGHMRAGDGAHHERVHARTLRALVKKGLAAITREDELTNRWGHKTGKTGLFAHLTDEGRRLAGMKEAVA